MARQEAEGHTTFAESWERLINPRVAIELGKPRRGVTLAQHIDQLDLLVRGMKVHAADDELYALQQLAFALASYDNEEVARLIEHAVLAGSRSVEREFRASQLAAFVSGLRCAQRMSAPRKAKPRSKAQRRRGGAR